jgi:hypothetical protein
MMLAWFGLISIATLSASRLMISSRTCHSGLPQGSHLGHLFFINNVDKVFRIFQHASALGYANDLKLFMIIESVDDCHRF